MKLLSVFALRPLLKRLDAGVTALERIADCMEEDLAQKGTFMRAPLADTSGEEPEALYTDEEWDAAREVAEAHRRGERQH